MPYAQTISALPLRAQGAALAAKSDAGQHHVSIGELLTAAFFARHTRFTSIDAFFHASGLDPQGLADLDVRTRCLWDAFVRAASSFPNWEAMLRTARGEWILRRMGLTIDA